jgi:hypothetical protein
MLLKIGIARRRQPTFQKNLVEGFGFKASPDEHKKIFVSAIQMIWKQKPE